jgi:hypothetical protein
MAKAATKKAKESPEQIENLNLQGENELESMPPRIQNGRFSVNFLKPHFEYDAKHDARSCGIELSLELTDDHAAVLPREITKWMDELRNGGVKSMSLLQIPACKVEIGFTPEPDDRDLPIKAAEITKVALAVIEKEGDGQAIEIIRLTFRILVPLTKETEQFTCRHYGKTLWMSMQAVQGTLL